MVLLAQHRYWLPVVQLVPPTIPFQRYRRLGPNNFHLHYLPQLCYHQCHRRPRLNPRLLHGQSSLLRPQIHHGHRNHDLRHPTFLFHHFGPIRHPARVLIARSLLPEHLLRSPVCLHSGGLPSAIQRNRDGDCELSESYWGAERADYRGEYTGREFECPGIFEWGASFSVVCGNAVFAD